MAPPVIKRADFSQGLVHLTRERYEYDDSRSFPEPPKLKRTVSAFDVLKEILLSGTVKASGNEGFVKGGQKAACFSEVPLSSVFEFASPPNEPKARYRFYGVCLSKSAAFAAGGRPVIYLPDAEAHWIPADQKWRHVRFEHNEVDFTHEREWRALGDFSLAKVPGLYVLVWSATEAKAIAVLDSPVRNLIRGILPMEHLIQLL